MPVPTPPVSAELPPLSLYVHLPWCVEKCPYCDFNSHPLRGGIPERDYIDALLRDLHWELSDYPARPLRSIFFGGGTPSLFSAEAIGAVISAAERLCGFAGDIEITLEANPGTLEAGRFQDYRAAGVNRLSIGVQSFDDGLLKSLGRIHDSARAEAAIESAVAAGFQRFNVDLMYGLPGQSVAQAEHDVHTALSMGVPHISYYELTIEPNTAFGHSPPPRPDEAAFEQIEQAGRALLAGAGFQRYEISAWAGGADQPSRHNLNYWRFGDYLGIGAGAHGKRSRAGCADVVRRARVRHPKAYQQHAGGADVLASEHQLGADDLAFESLLNGLRLLDGIEPQQWQRATGLAPERLTGLLAQAHRAGEVERTEQGAWRASERGLRYLDTLLSRLLPDVA